jgi:hypothetical protein
LVCQIANHAAGNFNRSGSLYAPSTPVVFEQVISHPYADSEVALFLGNARFKTGEFPADGKIHPLAITALTPEREPIGMERVLWPKCELNPPWSF